MVHVMDRFRARVPDSCSYSVQLAAGQRENRPPGPAGATGSGSGARGTSSCSFLSNMEEGGQKRRGQGGHVLAVDAVTSTASTYKINGKKGS